MNLLNFITRAISDLGYDSHPAFLPVLSAATKLREGSDGARAQAFADEVFPLLTPILPALGQYAAIVAVCEKHVGQVVNAVESLVEPAADSGVAEPLPADAPAE